MSRFDSIVVGNDLVSEHWLAEQFPATVKALRANWKEREDQKKTTPRSGLLALSRTFGADLVRLRERSDHGNGGGEQLRALHATVRKALQISGEELAWAAGRAGGEMTVPAVVSRTPSGTHLLVLQARDAETVEDVLDAEGAGHLLSPATVDGAEETGTARVISGVFRTEEPPSLVLVTAGAWVLLAERGGWPEGRWLAVDLATALERRDTKATGELETIAALVGGDTLLPADDGTTLLLTLLDDSVKHAVGVSKDLRHGVRESIELLATDVLRRRRARGLPDHPGLATELTRQSLRYLYRILFLLYAEARPELGVLPVGAPEYAEGYGLDRLRELVLTELTSPVTASGTHFYQSLGILFRLVNEGYPPETLGPDGVVPPSDDESGLRFEALRADLFSHDATALIDEVGLGNACLQQVLRRLLLSPEKRGRDRGFVSYAQLGINQLGAVYEGLMSYSGSIATDHMVEVAKDGDSSKGSWVVPVSSTEGFDEKWFVQTTNPETGVRSRVTYAPGDFVFRLSGRERQRSASYYTPEVLTRCVVKHSLAELLSDDTPAARILELRVCEPALGSGAFLIEAVNQLADQYLKRRQTELKREIPPEEYPAELQKVKAYLALHNCYGVDLNATAVELAEITLWLDAMHPGLRAPWFGLHLRRGNSLIGARRETYTPAHLAKRAWLTTVPTAHPLGDPVPNTEVHHFLLPAAGWGAVADTPEAKEGRPTATAALKAWRKAVTATLSKTEQTRLQALGQRVEMLWMLTQRRLKIAETEIRRRINIWGADNLQVGTGAVQREHIEASLTDPDSAYRRLRRVMDAWAALWFWPVSRGEVPPTREQWLTALEALLGTTSKAEARGGRGLFADNASWAELDEMEQNETVFAQMRPVAQMLDEYPWLATCEQIAEKEGFFHWELDFAPVFAGDGFDLQIGNPPWIPPTWDDPTVLADHNPWFVLAKADPESYSRQRKFALRIFCDAYLDERAAVAGLINYLGNNVQWARLRGVKTNVYRCFIDKTWRSMAPAGAVGLIHPDSHLTELGAGGFRKEAYRRTRRHWGFTNQLKLFEDVGNTRSFAIVVYGCPRPASFLMAAWLYQPDTVDRSLAHDGSGQEPGIKDESGAWDIRPHKSRIIFVDEAILQSWATVGGSTEDDSAEARPLPLPNQSSQNVLSRIATAPRFEVVRFECGQGWVEELAQRRRYLVAKSSRVADWFDVVIQGPHLAVANPLFQEPNPTMKSHRDYSKIDLEWLSDNFIPRTSFQRATSREGFVANYDKWSGKPAVEYWRLVWRRRVDSEMARTLLPALLPIGPTHIEQVWSLTTEKLPDLAIAAGLWASLPLDFLVKVGGYSDVRDGAFRIFPHYQNHVLSPELVVRSLRLNCLTSAYALMWEELFDAAWQRDTWTREIPSPPLGEVVAEWTMATPLRRDAERRQALVEIDALAAVMLGITAEELCAIYRTQFGVLRKYERVMQFDANGRQVPKDVLKDVERRGERADLGRYELPFTGVDREKEMTIAHEEFSRRAAARGTR